MDTDPQTDPTAATTVAELLDARRHDTGVGIAFDDQRWSWEEVMAESERYGAAIAAAVDDGVRHVGLFLENSPDYLFSLFGAALAGVTVVGLNTTRRGAELVRDIGHTDCALVLTDTSLELLMADLDLGGTPVEVVDRQAWRTAVETAPPLGSDRAVSPDDPLLLIFTSGSTSAPKAVIMSNRRAARAANGSAWFSPDDVLYCAMPLFHGNALNAIVFPALATGATIALRERFSASQFIDDLRHYRATFFTSVGRAVGYVLATPARPDDKEHSVKYGLAPESSPADMRAFRRRFGITCIAGYGSSENAVVFVPAPGMPPEALGRAQEGIDAAVADPETGAICAVATFDDQGRMTNAEAAIGEIVGRNVLDRFEGYYNNPEANAERSRNGWFCTGDLGYVDGDGFFYFAGRQGDWLRVDSENFATAPIERILGRFESLAAVAVYAVPDERTADDQVMASLELEEGTSFDPVAFEAFLAGQPDLGPKWSPRYVRLTTVPVGATNKIDRRRLQREGWTVEDPVWWRSGRSTSYLPFTAEDRAALVASFAQHGRSPTRAK
ncbi:MAG: AMP-binding protein [Acidimicrobiales bacterium]